MISMREIFDKRRKRFRYFLRRKTVILRAEKPVQIKVSFVTLMCSFVKTTQSRVHNNILNL